MAFPPAGSPPPYAPPIPAAFRRPFGVLALATLNLLGALANVACGALLVVAGAMVDDGEDGAVVLMVIGVLLMVFGAFHLLTSIGLFLLKGFGRVCQMIQSGIGLLIVPLGTIVSALILYYLTRPGVALLFSGRPPAAMTPEERALVAGDSDQGVVVVVVAIVGLFGGVALVGILAAIAIPALLRARMAGNEAVAIGNVRAMSSAQAAYAATHDGRFGTLACLTAPADCPAADGSVARQPFIDAAAAEPGPRSGYTFQLRLSPDHGHFVYWAEPDRRGQTGHRAFCVTEASALQEYVGEARFAPTAAEEGCPAGGRTL
ncbi:MAG: hypothetical protein ABIT71_00550 [Vicinamibacteraceae bacterium]